jgi:acetyl esterase/lipase
MSKMLAPARAAFSGNIDLIDLGSAALYDIEPAQVSQKNRDRTILYFHGSGYVTCGGELSATMALSFASAVQCKVFSSDYRMPPSHPFPAALDDGVDAYRYLLQRFSPNSIGIVGASAGAGLAAACILKSRDIGLPLPGAAVLLTPECDLTESGDSFATNRFIDVVLQDALRESIALYAAWPRTATGRAGSCLSGPAGSSGNTVTSWLTRKTTSRASSSAWEAPSRFSWVLTTRMRKACRHLRTSTRRRSRNCQPRR